MSSEIIFSPFNANVVISTVLVPYFTVVKARAILVCDCIGAILLNFKPLYRSNKRSYIIYLFKIVLIHCKLIFSFRYIFYNFVLIKSNQNYPINRLVLLSFHGNCRKPLTRVNYRCRLCDGSDVNKSH